MLRPGEDLIQKMEVTKFYKLEKAYFTDSAVIKFGLYLN